MNCAVCRRHACVFSVSKCRQIREVRPSQRPISEFHDHDIRLKTERGAVFSSAPSNTCGCIAFFDCRENKTRPQREEKREI